MMPLEKDPYAIAAELEKSSHHLEDAKKALREIMRSTPDDLIKLEKILSDTHKDDLIDSLEQAKKDFVAEHLVSMYSTVNKFSTGGTYNLSQIKQQYISECKNIVTKNPHYKNYIQSQILSLYMEDKFATSDDVLWNDYADLFGDSPKDLKKYKENILEKKSEQLYEKLFGDNGELSLLKKDSELKKFVSTIDSAVKGKKGPQRLSLLLGLDQNTDKIKTFLSRVKTMIRNAEKVKEKVKLTFDKATNSFYAVQGKYVIKLHVLENLGAVGRNIGEFFSWLGKGIKSSVESSCAKGSCNLGARPQYRGESLEAEWGWKGKRLGGGIENPKDLNQLQSQQFSKNVEYISPVLHHEQIDTTDISGSVKIDFATDNSDVTSQDVKALNIEMHRLGVPKKAIPEGTTVTVSMRASVDYRPTSEAVQKNKFNEILKNHTTEIQRLIDQQSLVIDNEVIKDSLMLQKKSQQLVDKLATKHGFDKGNAWLVTNRYLGGAIAGQKEGYVGAKYLLDEKNLHIGKNKEKEYLSYLVEQKNISKKPLDKSAYLQGDRYTAIDISVQTKKEKNVDKGDLAFADISKKLAETLTGDHEFNIGFELPLDYKIIIPDEDSVESNKFEKDLQKFYDRVLNKRIYVVHPKTNKSELLSSLFTFREGRIYLASSRIQEILFIKKILESPTFNIDTISIPPGGMRIGIVKKNRNTISMHAESKDRSYYTIKEKTPSVPKSSTIAGQ